MAMLLRNRIYVYAEVSIIKKSLLPYQDFLRGPNPINITPNEITLTNSKHYYIRFKIRK